MARFADHVMFCTLPTCQLSPPFGVSTVTAGTGVIAKSASLESTIVAFAVLITRIRAVAVGALGTVHAYVPADAVTFAIDVHAPFVVVL